MGRFRPLSATPSTLSALLLPGEDPLASCAGVGLYFGDARAPEYQQDGEARLTSHRLVYLSSHQPTRWSGFVWLADVGETAHFAGFLRSSAKVTLRFRTEAGREGGDDGGGGKDRDEDPEGFRSDSTSPYASASRRTASASSPSVPSSTSAPTTSWLCAVCGFHNPASPSSSRRCQLCGVAAPAFPERDGASSSLGAAASAVAAAATSSSSARSSPGPSHRSVGALGPASQGDGRGGTGSGATDSEGGGLRCGACTFDNHPSMVRCEVCDSPLANARLPTPLPARQARGRRRKGGGGERHDDDGAAAPAWADEELGEGHAHDGRRGFGTAAAGGGGGGGGGGGELESMRLSFRKGGDKSFYAALKAALRARAWDAAEPPGTGRASRAGTPLSRSGTVSSVGGESAVARKVGIDGVISAVNGTTLGQQEDMDEAFQDLEALMQRAQQMVELAGSLNAKLARQEATSGGKGVDAEAATAIRSSLLRLGLSSPAVTADMVRTEAAYHARLAAELGGLLLLGADGRGGIMGRGAVLSDEEGGAGGGAGGGGTRGSDSLDARSASGRWKGTRRGRTPDDDDDDDDDDEDDDDNEAGARGATGRGDASQRRPRGGGASSTRSRAVGGGAAAAPRGLIGLDEVWCAWNRARGVALVTPQALRSSAPLLEGITWPRVRVRTLRSGLSVLHTPRYEPARFADGVRARLARSLAEELLDDDGGGGGDLGERGARAAREARFGAGLATLDVASLERTPPALAAEMLEAAEQLGVLVRDEGGGGGGGGGLEAGGPRWFVNAFALVDDGSVGGGVGLST